MIVFNNAFLVALVKMILDQVRIVVNTSTLAHSIGTSEFLHVYLLFTPYSRLCSDKSD